MTGTYTDKDGYKRYIGSDRLVQRGNTPKKADGSSSSEYEASGKKYAGLMRSRVARPTWSKTVVCLTTPQGRGEAGRSRKNINKKHRGYK